MFSNFLRITFRIFYRNKLFSFLNILGLATGLATFILIMLWVEDELSFDRFNPHFNDLYRIVENQYYQGEIYPHPVTPAALGPNIQLDFPEVEKTTRIFEQLFVFKKGGTQYIEEFTLADSTFLEMFQIELLQGNPSNVLNDMNSVVITEDFADRYFAGEDPAGKMIEIDHQPFKVTGIMKNYPVNSHLKVHSILPFQYLKKMGYNLEDWGLNSFRTYALMNQGSDIDAFNKKIKSYIKDHDSYAVAEEIYLLPIGKIHLHTTGIYSADLGILGDIRYVRALTMIAVFILLIACINFINLSTAQSMKRAREVGIRKIAGVNKGQLILQFMTESMGIVLVSYLTALIFVELLLPLFNGLTGKNIAVDYFSLPFFVYSVMILGFTGFLAGSYPALLISSYKPLKILRGNSKNRPQGDAFRKWLVALQFTLSIGIIIGTLVIIRQIGFMQHMKLGFDRENVVGFYFGKDIDSHLEAFKLELKSYPEIISVTGADQGLNSVFHCVPGWRWDGKEDSLDVLIHIINVDNDFSGTFNIPLKEGRFYSADMPFDTSHVVINETAARLMGDSSVLGKNLYIWNYKLNIIGVVKDFNFKSLHYPVEPLVMSFLPGSNSIMFAKITSKDVNKTIRFIESTYNRYAADVPFVYRFFEEEFDKLYRSEQRISTIFSYFSFLAILISCLGLFGLSMYTAEQKTKEIGIRKAMGASIPSVTWMLVRQYLQWIILSIAIASPMAWMALGGWLENFSYRIKLRPFEFILAAGIAILIALVTIGYQSFKTAKQNPIISLRYE